MVEDASHQFELFADDAGVLDQSVWPLPMSSSQPRVDMTASSSSVSSEIGEEGEDSGQEKFQEGCAQCVAWSDENSFDYTCWMTSHPRWAFEGTSSLQKKKKEAKSPSSWHVEWNGGHFWVSPASGKSGCIIKHTSKLLDERCFAAVQALRPQCAWRSNQRPFVAACCVDLFLRMYFTEMTIVQFEERFFFSHDVAGVNKRFFRPNIPALQEHLRDPGGKRPREPHQQDYPDFSGGKRRLSSSRGDVAYMMNKSNPDEVFHVGQVVAVLSDGYALVVSDCRRGSSDDKEVRFWGVVANCEFTPGFTEEWPRPDVLKGDLKNPYNLDIDAGVPVVVLGVAAVKVAHVAAVGKAEPGSLVAVTDQGAQCLSSSRGVLPSRVLGSISQLVDENTVFVRVNMGDAMAAFLDEVVIDVHHLKQQHRHLEVRLTTNQHRIEALEQQHGAADGGGCGEGIFSTFCRDNLLPRYRSQTAHVIGWRGEAPLVADIYYQLHVINENKFQVDPALLLEREARILLIGEPNTGKTTLCHYLCSQWAENPSVSCVLYVPIADLRGCPTITLETILTRIYNVVQRDVEQLAAKLVTIAPDVVFIFDGIDSVQGDSALECFVSALLRQQVLWVKRVMLTARHPPKTGGRRGLASWLISGFTDAGALSFVRAYPRFCGRAAIDYLKFLASSGYLKNPTLCAVACSVATLTTAPLMISDTADIMEVTTKVLQQFYDEHTKPLEQRSLRLFLDICLWLSCCRDDGDLVLDPARDAVAAVEWQGGGKFQSLAGEHADPRVWDATRDTSMFWHTSDINWTSHYCDRVNFARGIDVAEFCWDLVDSGLALPVADGKLAINSEFRALFCAKALVCVFNDPPAAPASVLTKLASLVKTQPDVLGDLLDQPKLELMEILLFVPEKLSVIVMHHLRPLEEPDFSEACMNMGARVFQMKYNRLSHDDLVHSLFQAGLMCNNISMVNLAISKGADVSNLVSEAIAIILLHSHSVDMLTFLLDQGAEVDLRIGLMLACMTGQKDVVELLVQRFPLQAATLLGQVLTGIVQLTSPAIRSVCQAHERVGLVDGISGKAPPEDSLDLFSLLPQSHDGLLSCLQVLAAVDCPDKPFLLFYLLGLQPLSQLEGKDALIAACVSGDDDVFAELAGRGYTLNLDDLLFAAAFAVDEERLCRLFPLSSAQLDDLVAVAMVCCARGFSEAFKCLLARGKLMDAMLLEILLVCDVETLVWVLENLTQLSYHTGGGEEAHQMNALFFLVAGGRGDLGLLRALYEWYPDIDSLAVAADGPCFDYALSLGFVPTARIFSMLVFRGHLHAVSQSLNRWPDVCQISSAHVSTAIKNQDVTMLKLLLDRGASAQPEPPAQPGQRTFLWTATQSLPILRMLVEHGADVLGAQGPNAGETLLHFSHAAVDLSVLRFLVEECGLDASKSLNRGLNILHVACNAEIVRYSVKHGADPNQHSDGLLSPLMFAVLRGRINVVRALVEAGANLNPRAASVLGTPLTVSVLSRNVTIERYLRGQGGVRTDHDLLKSLVSLEFKLPPDLCLPSLDFLQPPESVAPAVHPDLEDAFRSGRIDINESIDGTPIIFMTARSGNVQGARLLVDLGVDLTQRDSEGLTALHESLAHFGNGVFEVLLESPSIAEVVNASSDVVDPPLLVALSCGSWEAARALITAGADVNCRSAAGETPLMRASSLGSVVAVVSLLQLGADPQQVDVNGRSAAAYAATDEIVEALFASI